MRAPVQRARDWKDLRPGSARHCRSKVAKSPQRAVRCPRHVIQVGEVTSQHAIVHRLDVHAGSAVSPPRAACCFAVRGRARGRAGGRAAAGTAVETANDAASSALSGFERGPVAGPLSRPRSGFSASLKRRCISTGRASGTSGTSGTS